MSRYLGRTVISFCLAVAILSMYTMVALAAPELKQVKLSGDINVSGQVSVNGQEMISGATFFSQGKITTAEDSTATISLGKLGRVQYSENTVSTLSFVEQATSGTLDAGQMRVSKPEGVTATFTTKDGVVVAESQEAALFSIDVTSGKTVVSAISGHVQLRASKESKELAAGESASVGQGGGMPGGSTNSGNQPRMTKLAIVLGGGFLAAILIAMLQDDDDDDNNGANGGVIISASR